MKEPDKVYILPSQYNLQYDNGGEEYIHKDVLLEWMNEQYDDKCRTPEFRFAMKCIIDKINSL